MVLDSISSNIRLVLSIIPSANVFVFGNFNIHHKDWFIYCCGTDRSGELCDNFSILNDLTQMVKFPTRIPDCGSHSPALLDFFLSFYASLCSTIDFPPLENYHHAPVSFSNDCSSYSQRAAPFHCIAYDSFRAFCGGLCDHLRGVRWDDTFKLSVSTASRNWN